MTCIFAESHTADHTRHRLGPLDEVYSLCTCGGAGWGGPLPLVTDWPGLYWRRMNLHKWFKVSESAHTHLCPVKTEDRAPIGHGQRVTKNDLAWFSSPSVTGTLLAHQSLKTTRGEPLPHSHTAAVTMAVRIPQTQRTHCRVHLPAPDTICGT